MNMPTKDFVQTRRFLGKLKSDCSSLRGDRPGRPFVSRNMDFPTAGARRFVMAFFNGLSARIRAVDFNHR